MGKQFVDVKKDAPGRKSVDNAAKNHITLNVRKQNRVGSQRATSGGLNEIRVGD